MPKKTKDESDESRLKEKVSARWKDNPGSDEKFRALRKRLKRAQRKRRGMVARKMRAAGKSKNESGAAT
jgi:hypothetical protein